MAKKTENINNSEMKFARLSSHSQALLDLLTGSGVIGDEKIEDDEKRSEKQRRRQMCFHNSMLLLKNYRTLAWLLECFPEMIAGELEVPFENIDKIADKLDIEMSLENRKVEARMSNIVHTRILIDRVNEALSVLEKKPGNGEIMYQIIYETYISKDRPKIADILYRLDISSRTYYRLRDEAIMIISARLWTLPEAESAVLVEILSKLNCKCDI